MGGEFHRSTSSHPDLLTYVARDATRWYAVLVNKNFDKRINGKLEFPQALNALQTYTLCESGGLRLIPSESQRVSGKAVNVSVPAFSVVLAVVDA